MYIDESIKLLLEFAKVSGHVLSSFEIICAMMHLPSINTTLERLFLMLLCRFSVFISLV